MQQKTEKKPPYRIFLSSAPEDDEWCRRLMVHFQPFIRQEKLKVWHQGLVEPGISAPEERTRALQKADLIILLLTPEYLASDLYAIEDAPLVVGSQQDGGVQVVPILCKECSWEIMGLADLQRLPDTGSPVPQAGEERDAVLKQVVNDVYHLLDPDWIVPTPHSLSYDERRNRRLLLQQVRTTWIEKGGMLEQSLQRTAVHLALRLQERPDALDNPWTRQVQELVRSPHMRSPGTSILQVYDEAYGQLLILGEPGAGKTTLLLELTRDLLKRAERAEDVPMPVVFNLSSWNSQHPSFASWMIEELKSSKYQISRQVAAAWIEQHQLIPLLDGLDEVPEPLQEACMQAINAYQQEQQHSPLVVSCRSKDYEKLVSHLKLSKAVRILPLTDEQIETYLAQDQGHLDTVRTMLHQDQELLKLARQPLMLSILTLAYQNSTVADFPAYNSPEQLQRVIFADYVRCMLQRREELPSWISFTQAQSWLHTIATNLQRNKQTV
ncbi:MAG TPA: NACHT domain-containing protein, partial [Ktedonobacteraceae bacterium]|nr:NACHT domain-containing protein [Ktedonobacteraceae bacterium]